MEIDMWRIPSLLVTASPARSSFRARPTAMNLGLAGSILGKMPPLRGLACGLQFQTEVKFKIPTLYKSMQSTNWKSRANDLLNMKMV
jgi:hypothetical protein